MKLIAKIIALPFILALTLLVAVLSFVLSFSGWLLSLAASLLGLLGALAVQQADEPVGHGGEAEGREQEGHHQRGDAG